MRVRWEGASAFGCRHRPDAWTMARVAPCSRPDWAVQGAPKEESKVARHGLGVRQSERLLVVVVVVLLVLSGVVVVRAPQYDA